MFLDSILGPLLRMDPFWAILLASFILTFLSTLVYKFTTDQHLMKILKDDMKKFQAEIKQFRENPAKALEIQKKAMETNMKYMMHSMKPVLVTFIPFILVFTWLNGHFVYDPISPGEKFISTAIFDTSATGNITILVPDGINVISKEMQQIKNSQTSWEISGKTGEYILQYEYKDEIFKQKVIISDKQEYAEPIQNVENSKLKILQLNNQKAKPMNLLGWQIGWLGTYLILSIVFNIILRKMFNLH